MKKQIFLGVPSKDWGPVSLLMFKLFILTIFAGVLTGVILTSFDLWPEKYDDKCKDIQRPGSIKLSDCYPTP